MSKEIMGLTLEEIETEILALGLKKYRARQIFEWLYAKSAVSFEEMTNLSKADKEKLEHNFTILTSEVKVIRDLKSTDGLTDKVLLEFPDGASVETVLMHHDYGYSICLSSQVGCNMGCAFCASGLFGMKRNLTAAEILAQLYYFQRQLMPGGERISRLVVMGSGEPMYNLDAVLKALDILHSDFGQCIGYRNMTISTCGIIPGIERMAQEGRTINLAVSLHSADDELRNNLMPINKKYNFLEVMAAADNYEAQNSRQVMYEYILLAGINDTEDAAEKLVKVLRGRNCVVNLIPANPVPEKGFQRPTDAAVNNFFQILKKAKINVTVRKEMGKDINAACGQLRASTLGRA